MAVQNLAPTAQFVGLQFAHIHKVLRSIREQNQEVLTLTQEIEALADDAIKAIRDNRQGEAIHSLVILKERTKRLREVEDRDVGLESTLRTYAHGIKSTLARLFGR